MKYLVVLLFLSFSISLSAKSTPNFSISVQQEQVISDLFEQLVKHQIYPATAIERSVTILLKSYPEKIDTVLKVAIDKYPHEYRQIMCGAVRAEPALTSDVVEIISNANIADSSQVVSIAITEEPAYAKEIVSTAALQKPNEIESIVRVAILTESIIAKNVVDDTMLSYPEKLLDILTVAIKALPNQLTRIVTDAIELFPDSAEEVITTAVSSTSKERAREIIATAINSGVSEEQATAAAIAGGATSTDVAKIDHYNY